MNLVEPYSISAAISPWSSYLKRLEVGIHLWNNIHCTLFKYLRALTITEFTYHRQTKLTILICLHLLIFCWHFNNTFCRKSYNTFLTLFNVFLPFLRCIFVVWVVKYQIMYPLFSYFSFIKYCEICLIILKSFFAFRSPERYKIPIWRYVWIAWHG